MPVMRAAQIARPNGPFEIVDRPIPQAEADWVRIKVQACGVCHSDSLVKEGQWPGLQYPRVPGHEVVGIVDAVGAGVSQWKPGQRVGVGWHGGHCGHCDACRSGDFFGCQVALKITGISFDGGYAEYMVAPAIALALVPEELSAVEAGPLMCAGITTYNALRNAGARSGDLVAVLGLGGLGPGGGTRETGRREGYHCHSDKRRRHERGAGRSGPQRNAGGCRRPAVAANITASVDLRATLGEGVV